MYDNYDGYTSSQFGEFKGKNNIASREAYHPIYIIPKYN